MPFAPERSRSTDRDGLHSQEHRCREYAAARGYEVEAVFHDDVSGGGDFMKRPGMVAMLNSLSLNRFRHLLRAVARRSLIFNLGGLLVYSGRSSG
jgi:DNA invertase Pin-like site-specific DNA recombinase